MDLAPHSKASMSMWSKKLMGSGASHKVVLTTSRRNRFSEAFIAVSCCIAFGVVLLEVFETVVSTSRAEELASPLQLGRFMTTFCVFFPRPMFSSSLSRTDSNSARETNPLAKRTAIGMSKSSLHRRVHAVAKETHLQLQHLPPVIADGEQTDHVPVLLVHDVNSMTVHMLREPEHTARQGIIDALRHLVILHRQRFDSGFDAVRKFRHHG